MLVLIACIVFVRECEVNYFICTRAIVYNDLQLLKSFSRYRTRQARKGNYSPFARPKVA